MPREEDKEHNRTLKRTVKKIRKLLDNKQYYPRANVMLDRVVLALVSKSVNVAQGVVSLIDAGLPEEAFGLSRTLVEVALSLRFVTNRDSERRALSPAVRLLLEHRVFMDENKTVVFK